MARCTVARARVLGVWVGFGLTGVPVGAMAAPAPPPPPAPRDAPSDEDAPPPPPATQGADPGEPEAPSPSSPGGSSSPRSTPPAPGTTPPPPGAGSSEAGAPPTDAPPTQDREDVDLSSTWGYSRGRIPSPRYVRPESSGPAPANPPGFYSGVRLEGNQTPPIPANPNAKAPVITWTGFERTPTGSMVFLQLSSEPTYEVTRKGATVTVRLRRTRVNVKNNRRFLDLRYFSTPVHMVRVKRRGRDTLLVLTLKREAEPDVRVVERNGHPLLVVGFEHASQAATAPTTAPVRPR